MPKNILFYIPNISRKQGGVFQYAMRVLESLNELDHQIIVYSISEWQFLLDKFKDSENIIVPEATPDGILVRAWNKLKRISTSLKKEVNFFPEYQTADVPINLIKNYNIELIHSPTQGYPLTEIPFIFTLHDVQELYLPQFFTPLERENRARNNRIGCERAVRIIVSYDHVKKDLIELFGVPFDKIDVVFIGTSDNSLMPRKNTLEIDSNLLLYPASTWPHKNHINLLKAFSLAKRSQPEMDNLKLICTGHITEHFKELEGVIKENGLEDCVEFKGLVSDLELKELYSTARAVIVPTKYEAGSFPLMESIVQHVPVICSNVTSLPKTIDNDEFIFAPDDLDKMSDCLYKITCDNEYRERSVANSKRVRKGLVDIDISGALKRIYATT